MTSAGALCGQKDGSALTRASTLLNSLENLTVGSLQRCAKWLFTCEFSREFMCCCAHWDSFVRNVNHKRQPVTLLSPLSPSKKGANPLWQAVLSPCHPFYEIIHQTSSHFSTISSLFNARFITNTRRISQKFGGYTDISYLCTIEIA